MNCLLTFSSKGISTASVHGIIVHRRDLSLRLIVRQWRLLELPDRRQDEWRLVGGNMRLPLRFTKLLRPYPPVPAIKQLPSQIHSSSCILKDNPEYVKLKRLHKERENRWVIAPTSSRSAASWFNSSFATNLIGDGSCEKKALTLTTQEWIGASRC